MKQLQRKVRPRRTSREWNESIASHEAFMQGLSDMRETQLQPVRPPLLQTLKKAGRLITRAATNQGRRGEAHPRAKQASVEGPVTEGRDVVSLEAYRQLHAHNQAKLREGPQLQDRTAVLDSTNTTVTGINTAHANQQLGIAAAPLKAR